MILLGIDPGLSGALVWVSSGGAIWAFQDMPVLASGRGKSIDGHMLADFLRGQPVGHCFIEDQWVRPGNGTTQAHKSGVGFGRILGQLEAIGIPYTVVSPRTWKAKLSVPTGKDAARARAKQLFPTDAEKFDRKKDDGRAEAALIALYGIQQFHGIAQGRAAA